MSKWKRKRLKAEISPYKSFFKMLTGATLTANLLWKEEVALRY